MKQFNLEEWLQDKSRKVVTREGEDVEIIHTNSPVPHHPIVGFIDKSIYTWTIDGKLIYGKKEQDKNDLFFADEELTELQKTLEEDCDCYVNLYNDGKTREELRKWIKAWCPRILSLARKELLKDLPKWKKETEDKDLEKHIAILEDGKVLLSNYLEKGDYYIDLEDLKTLPKEE